MSRRSGNGEVHIDGATVPMNRSELRMYMITQDAVKKQIKPLIDQVNRNTTSITYLKWILGGISLATLSVFGILLSVILQ